MERELQQNNTKKVHRAARRRSQQEAELTKRQLGRRRFLGIIAGSVVAVGAIALEVCRPYEQADNNDLQESTVSSNILEFEASRDRNFLPDKESLNKFTKLIAQYYCEAVPTQLSAEELASRVRLLNHSDYGAELRRGSIEPISQQYIDTTPMVTNDDSKIIFVDRESPSFKQPVIDRNVWHGDPAKFRRGAATSYHFYLFHEFLHSDLINQTISVQFGSPQAGINVERILGFQLKGHNPQLPKAKAFTDFDEMAVHLLTGIFNQPLNKDGEFVSSGFSPKIDSGINLFRELSGRIHLTPQDIYLFHRISDFFGLATHISTLIPPDKRKYPNTNDDGLQIMNAIEQVNERVVRNYLN